MLSNMIFVIVLIILMISICIYGILITRHSEKKNYNNGICPKCGTKYKKSKSLQLSGERDYYCPNCGNYITVSYNVD